MEPNQDWSPLLGKSRSWGPFSARESGAVATKLDISSHGSKPWRNMESKWVDSDLLELYSSCPFLPHLSRKEAHGRMLDFGVS